MMGFFSWISKGVRKKSAYSIEQVLSWLIRILEREWMRNLWMKYRQAKTRFLLLFQQLWALRLQSSLSKMRLKPTIISNSSIKLITRDWTLNTLQSKHQRVLRRKPASLSGKMFSSNPSRPSIQEKITSPPFPKSKRSRQNNQLISWL